MKNEKRVCFSVVLLPSGGSDSFRNVASRGAGKLGDATTREQVLTLSSHSRLTVPVNDFLGTGDDPAHDFSARVECTNGQKIIAERPMYFNYKGIWTGGHDVVGFSFDTSIRVVAGTGMRKFVDSLPGLGVSGANNLGQYIPVAVPDTVSYPGSDYYEIELGEYTQQLRSDLPPTRLRGYRQTNTDNPAVSVFTYTGPMIVAQRNRPVRVKFTNNLPTGAGGDLFLPVDTTVMGAGMGPDGMNMYTQNRAAIHLHGGYTPWISDGTPHQWITPAGESTPYPKGGQRTVCAGYVVRFRRKSGSGGNSGCLQRPRRRVHDFLLHQPAKRPVDVLS